jgi:hypothetical protein
MPCGATGEIDSVRHYLVRISLAIVDKFATLGRGGLGAIFGSKNLKAVLADGSKGIRVADPEGFLEESRLDRKNMLAYPFREQWFEPGPWNGMLVFDQRIGSYRNLGGESVGSPAGGGVADGPKGPPRIQP